MRLASSGSTFCGGLFLVLLTTGCGSQSAPVVEQESQQTSVADSSNSGTELPLMAIPGPDDANKTKAARPGATQKSGPSLLPKGLFGKKAASDEAPAATPTQPDAPQQPVYEKGSPEWLLTEIQRVRLLPLPDELSKEKDAKESDDEEDEDDQPMTPEQEKKLAQQIEQSKGIRRERNIKVIQLAEECIQKTNKNPAHEPLFCTAAHHLLDARLQMALMGDAGSVESIYEADKVFYDRNPKSDSAWEAALTLVNLTHANAVRYGRSEPRWLKEFSKQTQSSAKRFPDEMSHTVPMLMVAARSCEMNSQPEEATACYMMLGTKFKETPQGQQALSSLRRLQLKGKELELSGPGIDGSDINVKNMKGKMVLVVFWSTAAQPFVQQTPRLVEITNKYRKYLTVVGVNMDIDEKVVDSFVETNKMDWLQIFSENRQMRGWNQPLAVYYGVNSLPTMWLLDPNGIVAETNLDASNLEVKLREVYTPFRAKQAQSK